KSNIKGWQDKRIGFVLINEQFAVRCTGLRSWQMPMVSFSADATLKASIDAAAERAGLSRSAFIKRELAAATDARADDRRDSESDDSERVRIQVRIGKKQHRALAEDAARQHLLPSDIV